MSKNKYLFLTNFFISMFTFGGGYVVIPMMEKYFVLNKKYLSKDELYQLSTVAQTSPGAIAVNLAVLVGERVNRKTGALLSGIAAILPSILILSVISYSYTSFSTNPVVTSVLKGMEAGVAAIIVDLVLTMYQQLMKKNAKIFIIIPIIVFVANYFFNLHPMFLILVMIAFLLFLAKKEGS
ncbi:chromate transporter [Enterococcus sp. LJL98]